MITIEKWAGLVTNASPYALPPGAAVTQVNLQIISPGQIAVRPGLQAVTFDAHTASATASPMRAAMRYPGVVDSIIYQNARGEIFLAKGPH